MHTGLRSTAREPKRNRKDAADWLSHARQGDFVSAWRVSDALLAERKGRPPRHLPRHRQSVWDGTPLEGRTVIVHCYHGLGDTIQFIRYAPLARKLATELTVWAQPQLIPLLRCVRGIDRLVPLHDGPLDVDCEVGVEVMELPHVFRTTLESVPAEVPYIEIGPGSAELEPTARMTCLSRPGRDRLAVGLVWRSGGWDESRSIPFELIAPFAHLPGIDWHVHQQGPDRVRWAREIGPVPDYEDLLEEARAMRGLDLVISVDSMPAHLAGALGLPVWTLLPAEADWRWMKNRDDCPWYPTMRLFRQKRSGDWRPVIEEVKAALRRIVWGHTSLPAASTMQHPGPRA